MRIWKWVIGFLIILAVLFLSSYVFVLNKIKSLPQPTSSNGITSILVLGKGGEGHTAPDLTDTMMIAFINQNTQKINILSLPRDIWVPEIRAKLNSSYYWGKQKGSNGFDLVTQNVESITGIPVNYSLVVDFSLYKDLIDMIGGIKVNVENTFTDNRYPIAGKENEICEDEINLPESQRTYDCRYESITFEKGTQQMDGNLALKFVRSRNAEGDEGTDIAREKRQQKVISAIKEKLLSKEVLLNPKLIKNLYDVSMNHVETNFDKTYLYSLGYLFLDSRDNINYLSVPDDLLEATQNSKKYDYQYVFIPASGNWQEFQGWLKDNL